MKIEAKYQDTLKKILFQYLLNLLMLFIFWGGLLRKSYNYDTLYHMVVDDADVMTRIRGGRYAAALGDYLLFKLGLRTTTNISVTILITLIILAAAMLVMQLVFERFKPVNNLAKAGFYCGLNLVFVNVLFAESLMFSEYSVYFALAYFSAAVGVMYFMKRKYLPAVLMYALAVSFYQNSVVFAAVMSAFYICLDEKMKLSIKAVVREIIAVAACMSMGALDLLSIRIFEKLNIIPASGKVSGMGNMGQKLIAAAQNFVLLNKSAAGIMPNLWFPLLFAALVWTVIIYSLVKERKPLPGVFLLIVYFGSFALLYIIPLASMEFFCPPRLSFCFFMVQGLLLAASYAISVKTLHNFLGAVGVLYMLLHLFFADFVVTDHFVSNALDEAYVKMLYGEIVKYENESGTEVKKLAVMKDSYAPSSYEQVSYVSGQINERTIDAVPVSVIKVLTGKDLEKVEMPKDVSEKYFKDKDWDYFDLSEQLVIEGDTAYWCIF